MRDSGVLVFSSCVIAARIEMCAGEAGAGSSSLMKCPRKKGAVSKFQRCLAVACVMVLGGLKAAITVVSPLRRALWIGAWLA